MGPSARGTAPGPWVTQRPHRPTKGSFPSPAFASGSPSPLPGDSQDRRWNLLLDFLRKAAKTEHFGLCFILGHVFPGCRLFPVNTTSRKLWANTYAGVYCGLWGCWREKLCVGRGKPRRRRLHPDYGHIVQVSYFESLVSMGAGTHRKVRYCSSFSGLPPAEAEAGVAACLKQKP